MAYVDAEQLYSEVRKDGDAILEDALSALLSDSVPLSENSTISKPFNIIAVNTTPFARRDIVKMPLFGVGQNLLPKPLQLTMDGKHGYVLLESHENEILSKPTALSTEHGPVSGECTLVPRVLNLMEHMPSIHQWPGPCYPGEFKITAHDLAGTDHQFIRCEA